MKCELYITRVHGADDGKVVRIEARDGAKLLSRIELDVEGFALAIMGLGAVPAEHTTVRLTREQRAGGREYDPNVAPCDDAEFGMKP
jgi:hypothetical protein